jgi:hypothetical protein
VKLLRKWKFGIVAVSLLMLGGCITSQEAAEQKLANINKSCDKMGYTAPAEHQACMQNMIALIRQGDAERSARLVAVGQAMQGAGAAMQGAAPPPPQPAPSILPKQVSCQTFPSGQVTCSQF